MNFTRKERFTLIELLVVVAIIGILAAMIAPGLGQAREKSKRANCVANLKQIGLTMTIYADDFDSLIPPNQMNAAYNANETDHNLREGANIYGGGHFLQLGYLPSGNVFGCPSVVSSGGLSGYLLKPDDVAAGWIGGGNQFSAYFYRAISNGADSRIFNDEVGGVKKSAIFMDYSTNTGAGEIYSHQYDWTNIAYRDGHVAGSTNSSTPQERFTTDWGGGSNDIVWTNADNAE